MLVAASTTPSATPYTASEAANTAKLGASAIPGTHPAITTSPPRSTSPLSRLAASFSAASEPTPASSTIISSSDNSTEDSCHVFCTTGSRVVRLMNTSPWVKKPPAATIRAMRRAGVTAGASVDIARP